jgi:transposase InsO family protein
LDRSSAPRRIPHKTPPDRVAEIIRLRRLRLTAAQIAIALRMAISTVSAVLKRVGLGKRSRLEPPEPPNRYERRRPGELVHVDVKKLGRILRPGHRVTGDKRSHTKNTYTPDGRRIGDAGWEFVHVAIDDHSRLAYAEVLADEKATTATGFLERAIEFFASYGIRVERVMTDNGPPYISHLHAQICRQLGIRHLRTQPYRPRTNGKAERLIQTLLREWAYGQLFKTSSHRTSALEPWLIHYNFTRPHGALSHKPPGSRLTNVPRNYTYRFREQSAPDLFPIGIWLRDRLFWRAPRCTWMQPARAECAPVYTPLRPPSVNRAELRGP